jgi:hypothetical protein
MAKADLAQPMPVPASQETVTTYRREAATRTLDSVLEATAMRLLLGMLILALSLAGCSQFFVGFVSNPGGGALGITGTITTVAIGFVDNSQGTQVTFTAVTFGNTAGATTINFRGDKTRPVPRQASG